MKTKGFAVAVVRGRKETHTSELTGRWRHRGSDGIGWE